MPIIGKGQFNVENRMSNQESNGGAASSPGAGTGTSGSHPAPNNASGERETTGIIVGEIIGWRAWKYRDGFLTSPYRDNVWLPGEPMTGTLGDWLIGRYSFEGTGGVHAYKTRARCMDIECMWGVIGQVALWGNVYEHEHGYRAENARVVSIYRIDEFPLGSLMFWRRRRLRKLYGV